LQRFLAAPGDATSSSYQPAEIAAVKRPLRANDLEFEHKVGKEQSNLGTRISKLRRVTLPHLHNMRFVAAG
jgi:hypothetical protein